ncbi:hypothetical protein FNV43_RR19668 [Rhamnella rubrinervis]|uniref:Uncharacterized protein n=1 Tax=Rhamnella rubrinervis TaxID=2594499 RepID=A0A8K0GWG5_9ROSA|nr:hypothetical protein FNV43_RR19668 [Rhamnella rubrinervis]
MPMASQWHTTMRVYGGSQLANPVHMLGIGGKPHVRTGHWWEAPRTRPPKCPAPMGKPLVRAGPRQSRRKMTEAKSLMYPNAIADVDYCRVCVTSRSLIITYIKDILEKFLEDPDKPSSKLEDKDDMIRLALIYFLECGLLGKES